MLVKGKSLALQFTNCYDPEFMKPFQRVNEILLVKTLKKIQTKECGVRIFNVALWKVYVVGRKKDGSKPFGFNYKLVA